MHTRFILPPSCFASGHLLENKDCTIYCDDKQYTILAKGRLLSDLSTLEATFIKTLKPELCRQKEFVYTLKLVIYSSDFTKRPNSVYQSKRILHHPIRDRLVQYKILTTLVDCHSSEYS